MKLYETSVKRPVAVIMAVMVFVVLGLYSLSMLSMDMMPEMNLPYVAAITQYSGVAPSEIESIVTKQMESAMNSVSGIKSTQSISSEGTSIVIGEFSSSVDIDVAAQDVKDKVDLVKSYMPDDCDDPIIMKMDPTMMPVAYFSFSVHGVDLTSAKKYLEDDVSKKIESIDGVASVSVNGGTDREIQVEIDTNKLLGYNVSLSQVVAAIAQENSNVPGGSVVGNGKNLSIRSIGKFDELDDLKEVPITLPTGQTIMLRDVATVIDGRSEVDSYARLNGEDTLSVSVQKQSGANTVDVVNNIVKTLDKIKADNPNVEYMMTFEQASYIQNAISSVAESAVYGALFAIIILFLFLGSFRSSLVIGVTMPVSIITTFIGMYFAGMTINVVSLGGLSLGVGMLVDNAVVVLDNIFRRRKEFGEGPKTAAMRGSGEVVGAVVASVLTTCIVYLPLIFVDNLMAEMFKQLSFAIIFSQIASLITTFLLIPMLSSKVSEVETTNGIKKIILAPFNAFMKWLYASYNKLIRFALRKRWLIVLVMMVLFVGSLVSMGMLGMELMPSTDEGQYSITVTLPEGAELDETNLMTEKIEKIVEQAESVETVFATVSGSSAMGSNGTNSATIQVTLSDDRKMTTNDAVEQIRQALSNIAGAEISVEASSSTSIGSSTSSNGVSFELSGDDFELLEKYATQARDILASIDGVREADTSIADTKAEARIYIDRQKAAKYGLSTSSAANLIKTGIDGQVASQYTDDGKEYDIRVKLPENQTKTYEDLKNLKIKAGTGQWITIADIADMSIEQGYTTINRKDQKRIVTVSAQIYDTDMGTVTAEFNEKAKSIAMEDGYSIVAAGNYETMMDGFTSLGIAIALGLLLMYMIMAAQFESFIEPLLVMGSVPMSMIGVAIALLIDGKPMNVISFIGILMLSGMIVNNAIVLLDFINTAKKENMDIERNELVVKAGMTRMRPVLMTTLTSVLGFLPMVVSTSEGSEMMRPLAIVLLGGLMIGTILTLVFVPVLYTIADDKAIKRQAKKEKRLEKKAKKSADNQVKAVDEEK